MDLFHIVGELGFRASQAGDGFVGEGEVLAGACVPGTDVLRTSVVLTWADVIAGAVGGIAVEPRIPVTLDLEVQLRRPIRMGDAVTSEAYPLKVGRQVVVSEARFKVGGDVVATAVGSFMVAPDPSLVFDGGFPRTFERGGNLAEPFAERAGTVWPDPGVAEVPRRDDGLNGAGAIQGGLVALAAEEAATSLADGPVVLEAMNVRYLRPFTVGPARAVATGDAERAVVHLTDVGASKLGAVVTTTSLRV
jgi:acyl-coenzyme A thioesterase PaaI-like protein